MGSQALFFKNKPIFGLDIGLSTIKVMQIKTDKQARNIIGYGVNEFDPKAVKDGVITDQAAIVKVVQDLMAAKLVGRIDTNRVNIAIPSSRTFTRSMALPLAAADDLDEAVRLDAEQYIPLPLSELYMDHSVIRKTDKEIEMLAVAVPKKIVDSYLELSKSLNFEVMAIEPASMAACRIFAALDMANLPTLLIDFGSISADVSVYDGALITTGTVTGGGGDNFTIMLSKKLHVSIEEANFLKTKYGLAHSHWQDQILAAVKPSLDQIVQEIRRVLRYYEEHSEGKKISQIVTTGGGANLPGLNDFLTNSLRMPSRSFEPWQKLNSTNLQSPDFSKRSLYSIVAGLAVLSPGEVFS